MQKLEKLRLDLSGDTPEQQSPSGPRKRPTANEELASQVFEALIMEHAREDYALLDRFFLEELECINLDTSNEGAFTFIKLFCDYLLGEEFRPALVRSLNKRTGLSAAMLLRIIQHGEEAFEFDTEPIVDHRVFASFEELFIDEGGEDGLSDIRMAFDRMLF
jgi:hypothetical protein